MNENTRRGIADRAKIRALTLELLPERERLICKELIAKAGVSETTGRDELRRMEREGILTITERGPGIPMAYIQAKARIKRPVRREKIDPPGSRKLPPKRYMAQYLAHAASLGSQEWIPTP